MEPQRSIMLTWLFVFSLPSVYMDSTKTTLTLESSVFVAFSGKDLRITGNLMTPANQSKGTLRCFSPSKEEIYHYEIPTEARLLQTIPLTIQLRNLSSSGTYYCEYKDEVRVPWFLRVREKGYREVVMWDYTEFITVAAITGVLLLFSVFGSVYVFRGTWKEKTESGEKNRKQKQNKEDRRTTEIEEDNMDMTTAQSTSFYASLAPRPRSIYDVLDYSAANADSDQKEEKSRKSELLKMTDQSAEHQEEVVFESVYENF